MINVSLYSKTGTIDISDLIVSATWSGDINTLPRTLELEIQNSSNINLGRKIISANVGDMVIAKFEQQEIFRGFIFKQLSSSNGNESLTIYDELIYATKNNDSLIVKNKTASEVITAHMKKFGIAIGSIQPTTYKLPKTVFQNRSLSEIWEECLTYETSKTGKSFHMFSSKGLVYLWKREKATIETISIDNVITGSKETSIEDLRTQVLVTKGQIDPADSTVGDSNFIPYKTKLIADSNASKSYGIMQHVEEVDEKATDSEMNNIGNTILAQLNKPTITSEIEFLGDVKCITGRMIEVSDRLTGIAGKFYITSDSHSFSNGIHKMSLQLSKKLE